MSHTYKDVKEWADRMQILVPEDDKDLLNRKGYIIHHCRYGNDNFCDGRPIRSNSKKKCKCPLFENGRCNKGLHKGAKKNG